MTFKRKPWIIETSNDYRVMLGDKQIATATEDYYDTVFYVHGVDDIEDNDWVDVMWAILHYRLHGKDSSEHWITWHFVKC